MTINENCVQFLSANSLQQHFMHWFFSGRLFIKTKYIRFSFYPFLFSLWTIAFSLQLLALQPFQSFKAFQPFQAFQTFLIPLASLALCPFAIFIYPLTFLAFFGSLFQYFSLHSLSSLQSQKTCSLFCLYNPLVFSFFGFF